MAKHSFVHVIHNTEGRVMAFNTVVPPEGESVDTGDWIPALLMYRLPTDVELYVQFRNWDQQPERHSFANFGWSDSSGTTEMWIPEPEQDWDSVPHMLGLNLHNGPKLAKRLKEIVRISRYHTSAPANIDWVSSEAINIEGDEKYYDGMNVISRSFARKMGLKAYHVRGNFRHIMRKGLIKGDAIVISDAQMVATHGQLYDMVIPEINLKSEISTTGWSFTTFNPHHAHNQAMFDVQSASWIREWLFPRALMKDTLTNVIDTALESLRNGEWPSWMIMAEEAHTDDFDHISGQSEYAADAFNRHYLRWQMHGMKLEQSASILGMAANSFKSRLQSRLELRDRNGEWRPMMWLPLSWAFYGHIMTHESLEMAGYVISEDKRDELFFHEESGSVSIPGSEFSAAFEQHGTWDLDDSAKFFLRRDVGTGNLFVIIVRSPNSDGEWSYHKVSNIENLPWYHMYGEIPEVDLANAPRYIEEIMSEQDIVGMPPMPEDNSELYTADVAFEAFITQADNPGIGAVANAMMVYYSCMKQSPTRVLATMGDMVDCVQQTPYSAGFEAIDNFTKQLWAEVMQYGMVDSYMALTRMPKRLRNNITKYDGFFMVLFQHYRKEVKRYSEQSRTIAFIARMNNPIPEINAMSNLDLTTGARWVNAAERRFAAVSKNNKGSSVYHKNLRTALNRQIIRDMVTALSNMTDDEANRLVLAMYRFCTIPGTEPGTRYGRSDRCLFSPLAEGEQTTMDIFIRALISINATREVN